MQELVHWYDEVTLDSICMFIEKELELKANSILASTRGICVSSVRGYACLLYIFKIFDMYLYVYIILIWYNFLYVHY
jgi:hypothetical protein